MTLPNIKRIKQLLNSKPEWNDPDVNAEAVFVDNITTWSEDIVREVTILVKEYEELEFRMKGLDK